jgi:uncharacterized protein (DUF111 family)
MVSVLCDEARIPAMEDILFRETATLGIRRYPVSRHKLKRQATEVETRFGTIRGKLGWLENRPANFSPEYDDCARVASSQGVALREVYDAAHAAYQARQPDLSAPDPPQSHAHSHSHSHQHGDDASHPHHAPHGH